MVTIYLTEDESKMLVALADSAVKDYELKNLASRGKYTDLVKAGKGIIEKVRSMVELPHA
jgi:hypothetical protein